MVHGSQASKKASWPGCGPDCRLRSTALREAPSSLIKFATNELNAAMHVRTARPSVNSTAGATITTGTRCRSSSSSRPPHAAGQPAATTGSGIGADRPSPQRSNTIPKPMSGGRPDDGMLPRCATRCQAANGRCIRAGKRALAFATTSFTRDLHHSFTISHSNRFRMTACCTGETAAVLEATADRSGAGFYDCYCDEWKPPVRHLTIDFAAL